MFDLFLNCVFKFDGIYLLLHFVGAIVILWWMGNDVWHKYLIVKVFMFPVYFVLWPFALILIPLGWIFSLLVYP